MNSALRGQPRCAQLGPHTKNALAKDGTLRCNRGMGVPGVNPRRCGLRAPAPCAPPPSGGFGRVAQKFAASLALCALVQGCVGISVSTAKTERFQNPRLAEEACPRGLRSIVPSGTNAPIYTTGWLESHWGKPTTIREAPTPETGEIWTYSFGLNWNGTILFVLIPIPLELPIGRERVEVLVRSGEVISGKQRFTHTAGGIVG